MADREALSFVDPSWRLLLRSPGVSAVVMGCVLAVTAGFAWSCARWRHVDPFVEFPVQVGGYVLLAWVALVGVVPAARWWGSRREADRAFTVALQAVMWVVLPAVLLGSCRVDVG